MTSACLRLVQVDHLLGQECQQIVDHVRLPLRQVVLDEARHTGVVGVSAELLVEAATFFGVAGAVGGRGGEGKGWYWQSYYVVQQDLGKRVVFCEWRTFF